MITALTIITTLLGTGVVSSVILQLLKGAIAKIPARYSSISTQIVLAIVSLVVVLVATLINLLPANVIAYAIGTFVSAMGIYEVLYKALYQQTIAGKV
jgi:hypothetical protein